MKFWQAKSILKFQCIICAQNILFPYLLLWLNSGPTVAAELTTLVGEQKHIVREGATTLVAQCTGESSACYNALNSAVCTSQVNHNTIVIPNRKKCRLYKINIIHLHYLECIY